MRVDEHAESDDRLQRAILESVDEAIFIVEGFQFAYCNTATERLFGCSREDLVGQTPDHFSPPQQPDGSDSAELARSHITRALSEGPHRFEWRHTRYDGTPFDAEVSLAPMEGRHESLVAVVRDITERKQHEQHLFRAEKMAALCQIIAGVAHEINNPNNFIHFNLPILHKYMDALQPVLLRRAQEDSKFRILNMTCEEFIADFHRLIENMQHGSSRITEIVAELKEYIRSHESAAKKPRSLAEVVNHVMNMVGKQVRKTVKRFDIEVEEGLPPVVMDEGRIEQVLVNLIINAGQAVDKADSHVLVRASSSSTRPGWVTVVVEDNGCGISNEHMGRIFDPFFTTKGPESGTGLGLSISQKIVEEHGGEIRVESTVGEGTRVTIELPTNGRDRG